MMAQTCPVCEGNGLVMNGFYNRVRGRWSSSDCSFETCRSCNGTGVIWYYDDDAGGDDNNTMIGHFIPNIKVVEDIDKF